ncbi:hypothetical protein B0H21DRAFT_31413 [Amylocystis lapponica]|nr:hypothetical protein B0H21DRAFT_31413 [Amylocystis lapponica]
MACAHAYTHRTCAVAAWCQARRICAPPCPDAESMQDRMLVDAPDICMYRCHLGLAISGDPPLAVALAISSGGLVRCGWNDASGRAHGGLVAIGRRVDLHCASIWRGSVALDTVSLQPRAGCLAVRLLRVDIEGTGGYFAAIVCIYSVDWLGIPSIRILQTHGIPGHAIAALVHSPARFSLASSEGKEFAAQTNVCPGESYQPRFGRRGHRGKSGP